MGKEDRFELGKKAGIEIGERNGYGVGYGDGKCHGYDEGYDEGYELGRQEAPKITDYDLEEFLDCKYPSSAGLDILMDAVVEYVGDSPYYKEKLKEKIDELFKF